MVFSIVTICKNEGLSLQKTLASIEEQTFRDFELIFIDGHSTDPLTRSAIDKSLDKFSYFVSETDSGIYNAQNKGLSKASGNFVLFLNAGDMFAHPKVLERVSTVMGAKAADVYYGDMWIENADQTKTLGKMPKQIHIFHMLRSTLWHPASFIRRSLFDEFGTYNENLKIVSDYEFFLKLVVSKKVTFLHVNETISVFNLKGIGSSPRYRGLHQAERYQVQKELVSVYFRLLFFLYNKCGLALLRKSTKVFWHAFSRVRLKRVNDK